MATRTISNTGGNWNATGTWVEGAVPTNADDVVATGTSGALTLNVSGACRSIDLTGYTNTFNIPASVNLTIGTSTVNPSNVALKFVSGMTFTTGGTATSVIIFASTSSTTQTIDCANKTIPSITFNGANSSYQLSSTLVQYSAANMVFQNGTFNTNNFNCSFGTTSLSAGTKTLTLGSSTITVVGGGLNFSNNITGFTLNAGTSSIIFNPTGAVTPTFTCGNNVFYDVSVVKSAGGFNLTNSPTFHNFTMDNTVLGGGNRALQLNRTEVIAITGTLLYKGNNANASRGRLTSNQAGYSTTIALGATGTLSLYDIDIADINVTGTNTPVAAAGGRFGNEGGNTNITFPTPVTYYWVGNGGNMSTSGGSHWSLSSGGATVDAGSSGTAIVPLVHDTVIFDSNSITTSGQTIINDMMRMPGLDFTNVLNNPVYNPRNPNGATNFIYGSLIFKSGMTISTTSAAGGTISHQYRGRGTHSIKMAGLSWPNTTIVNAPGGTYTMLDDFSISNSAASLTLTMGTFDMNDFNVSIGAFSSSGSDIRTLDMGTGTMTLTGSAANVWNTSTSTNMTIIPGNLALSAATSTGTRGLLGGGSTNAVGNVSITSSSDTLQFNNFACADLNLTNFSGAVTTATNGSYISGNFTIPSTVTSVVGGVSFNFVPTSGTKVITTNGITIDNPIAINAVGATVQLADNLVVGPTRTIVLTAGTFDPNNKNVTTGIFNSSNTNTRALNMGSGTWTLNGTGTVWTTATSTGLTFNAGTSTLVINDTSATGKSIARATNQALYDVTLTGGSGVTSFINALSSTIHNLNVTTPPANIRLNSPATYIFTGTLPSGTAGNLITIDTNNAGVAATISKASGVVANDYLSIKDIIATGGAYWLAGANSTNVSGNSGWVFHSNPRNMQGAFVGFSV